MMDRSADALTIYKFFEMETLYTASVCPFMVTRNFGVPVTPLADSVTMTFQIFKVESAEALTKHPCVPEEIVNHYSRNSLFNQGRKSHFTFIKRKLWINEATWDDRQ